MHGIAILDSRTVAELEELRRAAEVDPIPLAVMLDAARTGRPPRALRKVAVGTYTVCFSVEEHPAHGTGAPVRMRHASIACLRRNKRPNAVIVIELIAYLGITIEAGPAEFWDEPLPGGGVAINVAQAWPT
jgi:hypothetical protein